MAKENIDHTFKLKHEELRHSHGYEWYNWVEVGRGKVSFCRNAVARQFGAPPKGAKNLFMRVSSKKPKDKEVQWWHISIRAHQPLYRWRSNWVNDIEPMEVRWSPSADAKKVTRELMDSTSAWLIKRLKLKKDDVVKLWVGCWVEE